MNAAIDVGSNTLRLLVARCSSTGIRPASRHQQITRLAGGFLPDKGLSQESIERTLAVFNEYAVLLRQMEIEQIRVVGTAVLRRAKNSQYFINLIKLKTRLQLEIISGDEEARLSAAGVLSILDPCPTTVLIVDIGGGSTEIILCENRQIFFSRSYPIGVVQLCEEMPASDQQAIYINDMVVKFAADLLHAGISPAQLGRCQLVGTAGTITTLAAMKLKMSEYSVDQVNNLQLSTTWLENTRRKLHQLSVAEREKLPGLEQGRGDLIVPGLELVLALCRYFKQPSIRVSDAGLLEGILLDFCSA